MNERKQQQQICAKYLIALIEFPNNTWHGIFKLYTTKNNLKTLRNLFKMHDKKCLLWNCLDAVFLFICMVGLAVLFCQKHTRKISRCANRQKILWNCPIPHSLQSLYWFICAYEYFFSTFIFIFYFMILFSNICALARFSPNISLALISNNLLEHLHISETFYVVFWFFFCCYCCCYSRNEIHRSC